MSTAAAEVDPRMRARRVAVIRAEGRRRLRVLAVALGVVALAAAAWGISRTPLLDVDRIAVTGIDPANRAEVLNASNVTVGVPMLFLDVDDARRSITSLPWVRSAQVWRDWPATVRITVEPRVPVAVVPAPEGRTALVDAYGYVIEWGSESAGVTHVSVPFSGQLGDIHTAAEGPLAVVAALPADLRAWVSTVTVEADRGNIGLALVGGAAAVLGEPVLIDDKISALRAVLATADLECVTIIDVTTPDIAAVTRQHPC